MNIGLVSDTHMFRFSKALPRELVRGFREQNVSAILHMGDFTDIGIVEHFEAIAPFDAVAGNNDNDAIVQRFGRKKIVEIGEVRIGMVHGDSFTGKTLRVAQNAFLDERVDAILFGHSHQPYCQLHGKTWIVNPGSPTDKRLQPQFSYCILTIENDTITPQLYYYSDKSPVSP
ncbi:MAG: metallophosphoesterase family protein [Candidatus Eremiobacteraeota bacterium]|nr:metallophosphoesterase family protein [Candidatus Eremiobacteraeota bacterium]